jgi:hypothetical protein
MVPVCARRDGGKDMRHGLKTVALVVLAIAAVSVAASVIAEEETEEKMMAAKQEMMEMPFGGQKDVAFAGALWSAMEGYDGWLMQSDIMPGKSPHGMFIRLYYSIVTIDDVPYHVVVKDNYGGEGVTIEMVGESPADYLMAVTPMVQRESGYDADNNDWFWVKYAPDGTVGMNDKSMALAGRVAKGSPTGCIACHANAGDGDYLFLND